MEHPAPPPPQAMPAPQQRGKRKRTVSISTDDLPLSALGHAASSAAGTTAPPSSAALPDYDDVDLCSPMSAFSSSTSSSASGTSSFAPLPSPFGPPGSAFAVPSALSGGAPASAAPPSSSYISLAGSAGASALFGGKSADVEALLLSAGTDSLNSSLDAAYWQRFLSTDGEELERESIKATEDVLVGRMPMTWSVPSTMPSASWTMGSFSDPTSPSSTAPGPVGTGMPPQSSHLSPSSSFSTPAIKIQRSSPIASPSTYPVTSTNGLPLLTPKPDPATSPLLVGTGSSDGLSTGLTVSTGGLTSSRDSSPKGLLARINLLEQTIDGQLKSLKYLQSNLMEELGINISNQAAEVSKVQQTHEEINRHLNHSIDTLTNLNDTQLLVAADAHRLAILLDKLDLHAQRLRIYQEELNNALSGRPYVPAAALIITQQPFPCTIKQGKSIDEPVEITLLTGAKVEIQKMSPVKAEMLNEDTAPSPKKKSTEPPIQNGVQQMREDGVAIFRNLVFPHGSRVKAVNIRFSQELTINGRVMTIYSEPSKPFIVMTNHGQRSATEGKLLKKNRAFDRPIIPWPAFANALQLHYLQETKQDPLKPLRILSYRDLEYIRHYKFGGKNSISSKEYDSFWEWFGSILYKIRNPQKHILPMWIKGLIYGLISREECDSLMQANNALPGSFLIRFSDSCAGQFVVVYVQSVTSLTGESTVEVKHYLLQSEVEKRGTLPDFLRSCDKLRYILQRQCDDTGEVALKPIPKDTILEAFYSKEHAPNLPPGYDISGLI